MSKMKVKRTFYSILLSSTIFGLGCSLANAQNAPGAGSQLEEVIVTAEKFGATSMQKTPIAISAFSAADIKNTLSSNIKDIAIYTPGLNISQLGDNAEIYIRGIGSNNVYNGSDPDVTIQIDGVYIARPSDAFEDFLDVDRVEVLRGPQGTIYGRNAVGGTINVISKQPSDTFTDLEQLTVGNFNLLETQAYVSGPLIPGKLQGSLAVNYSRHGSYVDNIAPGGSDLDDAHRGGVRGQLRWELTPEVTATTRFDIYVSDGHPNTTDELTEPVAKAPLANSAIGTYTKVALNSPQTSDTRNGGVSEEVDWGINDHLNLKSITAYRKTYYRQVIDNDRTELNAVFGQQAESEAEETQEFNLQLHYDGFDGVAGLYFFHDHGNSFITANIPPAIYLQATPYSTSSAQAGFAQGTYHVTQDVSLVVGYRYTLEQKSITQDAYETAFHKPIPGTLFTGATARDFHGITPKFGINWNATNDALLYFSATRGYKSGGTNAAAASTPAESFDPETIWSYEIGAKTDWFDHRFRANLTGFQYDYNDLQVQSILGTGVVSIANAASATVRGVEVELTAKPTPAWHLTSNFSLLNAVYSSFPEAAVPTSAIPYIAQLGGYNKANMTFNATDNRLDAAPHITAFAAAQHNWGMGNGGDVYARGEYYWQSRVYYDPSNVLALSQGAYGVANAYVGYTTGNGLWEVQLFAKNLADKGYFIAMGSPGSGPAGFIAPPRTFGARLTHSFGASQ